ncbi:PPOX class probable F420-dependent enzyme [Actinomyces bovis]|uniref:PPOX class probable F420-dependent enzyme n=1 Tax=Actinomyces bovis TaxID=1658 RepID=A0ABY1VQQ6_9ACTO|nr:pyridoxamine 5'-phosphate oxidase family protein [Actinomyces bovis]SPT54350.1 PPOX class probable F420-dependent enzyme [Actinomyces bovis]VEG56136.1 PPOX class probable F420-dependent enzyme [Actinomyces israelii]
MTIPSAITPGTIDVESVLPTIPVLLGPGRRVLLTTVDEQGAPHTRPVLMLADAENRRGYASLLTKKTSTKALDVRSHPRVTLSGSTPQPCWGRFSIEANARVVEVPQALGGPSVVRLEFELLSARVWVIYSSAPRDNEVFEIPVA